ncbi:DUF2269 family protein [Brevibacillus fluminis]|uniref:DUF2269 family protein n=1 Tax=Brevibacillus fluminis TaxID=511487 RepID=A0A3M8DB42_9BACL|nr:DUF2269 family protein [Brevibacillus fluminis]RNB84487.1 DUF2269 family protein [Brevibacillus fluminis]
MYRWIVFLHILSAMLSIGPFFVFFPFFKKVARMEKNELAVFIGLFRFCVQLSKHAGHVLVTTGVLLIWLGGWDFRTSWILLTLIVLVGSLYFFARAFSPILRALTDAEPAERPAHVKRLKRALYGYLFLVLLMLGLMVVKPSFW